MTCGKETILIFTASVQEPLHSFNSPQLPCFLKRCVLSLTPRTEVLSLLFLIRLRSDCSYAVRLEIFPRTLLGFPNIFPVPFTLEQFEAGKGFHGRAFWRNMMFWHNFTPVDSHGIWQVYRCSSVAACPGGTPGTCNGGLTNTPCAQCRAGKVAGWSSQVTEQADLPPCCSRGSIRCFCFPSVYL